MSHRVQVKRAIFNAFYEKGDYPFKMEKLAKIARHTQGHRHLLGSLTDVLKTYQGGVLIELCLGKVGGVGRLILRVTQHHSSPNVPGGRDRETTTYRFDRQDKIWLPAWIGEAYIQYENSLWHTDSFDLPTLPTDQA